MASSTSLLSRSEEDYIREGCRDNCRLDGRTRDEFRTYTIITGGEDSKDTTISPPLILSSGSARLISTNSDSLHILCSVKAELVHPAASRPDEGVIELHIDTLTTHSKRKDADELQAILSQLLVRHLVDVKALCIVPHHYVWRLHIDLYLLAADAGSLLDHASHVIRAALRNTLLPSVTASQDENVVEKSGSGANVDLLVDGDIAAAKSPPGVNQAPSIVTVTVLKCWESRTSRLPTSILLVDATAEEEACSYAQVHVAVNLSEKQPVIMSIHKSKSGSLPVSLLPEITATAITAAQRVGTHYQSKQPSSQQPHSSLLLQEQFSVQ